MKGGLSKKRKNEVKYLFIIETLKGDAENPIKSRSAKQLSSD